MKLLENVFQRTRNLLKPTFYLLLLIFFSSVNPIWSQEDFLPGYIVNIQGDTTYGFIEYGNPKSNATYCLFKTQLEDEKAKKYTTDSLLCYRFIGSKYYIAKSLLVRGEVRKYFLEYLLDGVVDIYFLAHPFRDYFYIEKDGVLLELSNEKKVVRSSNGQMVNQLTNPYTGVLQYIMRDAPVLSENIERMSFDHRSMIDLGRQYHELTCQIGEPCLIYSRDQQKLYDIKWRLRPGFYVGWASSNRQTLIPVIQSDLYFIEATNNEHQVVRIPLNVVDREQSGRAIMGQSYLYPAIALNLSSNWRTSAQIDVQYHNYKIEGREKEVSTDFLKILLSLNYEFLDISKIKPFLRAGVSWNKYFYRVNDNDRGLLYGSFFDVYQLTIHSKSHLNYIVGMGILSKIGEGPEIKVEFAYDSNALNRTFSNSPSDLYNHTNSILLQLGFFF